MPHLSYLTAVCRHDAAVRKAQSEENRLAADLEAARTEALDAQLKLKSAEHDAASAARLTSERDRLAQVRAALYAHVLIPDC